MRTMKAAEFKAKCLKVMDEVAASGEEVVVTKRGKVVARVLPPLPAEPPKIGWGAGAHLRIEYHGDLVAPLDDEWDMDERNLLPESAHMVPNTARD